MSQPELAAATRDAGVGSLTRGQTALMVAALVTSVISYQLNATMLAPAIHDINTHLGPNAFASMSTYFYLSAGISNVVAIRWSDYLGRKRVLLGILIVLCIGTVLCIVGTSLPVVLVGRILQGGCNVTYGLSFLIMREHLSGKTFGFCCGITSSVFGGVAGVDALLGGFMVDRWGYRSIFVLILVVGVVALAFSAKAVPADDAGPAASGRMDWVGAALIALTVAGIDLFFANGGHHGWSSPLALGFIVSAVVALVAFVVVEKRLAQPLVRIDQISSRYAWPLIVVTILVMASFIVVVGFVIPSLAEDHHVGFAASGKVTARLFLTPASVLELIAAPLVGLLAVRVGFVPVLRTGLVLGVGVTVLLACFTFDKTMVVILMALFGLAFMAVGMTALSVLGVLQAPEREPGSLPGISNAAFGVGSSLGFAWAGPIVGQGSAAGFQSALWICAGIGVAAVATSLILKPRPYRSPEL